MRIILIAIMIAVLGAGCASNKEVKEDTPSTETTTSVSEQKTVPLSNKQKAIALIESFENGDPAPIQYINPKKYKQHNLMAGDGIEGLGELMKHKPATGFKAKVIRSIEDGDLVMIHTEYDFFGPKIGFDVFRFEDGLIVEHWDNLNPIAPPNQSGHTQTDGPTTIESKDKTQANKALVHEFMETVLLKGQFDKMSQYFNGDAYIQHNPMGLDGLSGLNKMLQELQSKGITMVISKMHYVIGEGNFVLTISEGTFANKPYSYYDLFRVENGYIAEHWDVMEEILPKDQWKKQQR